VAARAAVNQLTPHRIPHLPAVATRHSRLPLAGRYRDGARIAHVAPGDRDPAGGTPLPKSDKPLHWDTAAGTRVR
jgi:hypothetical protein